MEDGSDNGRRAEDDAIVEALALGGSYREAGESVRRSARTVQRRMANAEFRRRVSQRRAEVLNEQVGRLVAGTADAIDVVAQEMRFGERSLDRIAAARLWLTLTIRWREVGELEARLSEIEAQLHVDDDAASTAIAESVEDEDEGEDADE